MKIIKNIMVEMQDGIKLATDLYIQDPDLSYPVLVNRTPYNKDLVDLKKEVEAYVEAGYAVVIQDVRGRYHSEGLFEAHQREIEDGRDCFQWLIRQSWCNGKIGTFGKSYHGGTQYFSAMNDPEGLKAMVPVVCFDDMFNGCCYQDGAKVLHDLRWTVANIVPDIMERARNNGEEVVEEIPEVYHCLDDIPVATDPAVQKYGKYYIDWITHDTDDDFWKRISFKRNYDQIKVPAMNVSGWYDIFVPSTINNYKGMRKYGGSKEAREYTRLIMGPWSHVNFTGKMNGFDFGKDAHEDSFGLLKQEINWYNHFLKGEKLELDVNKPVNVFLMGKNKWLYEEDWPLADTKYIPYYFHSNGKAHQTHSELNRLPPQKEETDLITYDPFDPTPTIGGGVILPGENAIGPRDQREVEERKDVLVFETESLEEELTIVGNISADLYVSSDCLDSDLTVKVCDVFPDGVSMLLCDGILRLRYRDSFEKPELLVPDQIYKVKVNVQAIANTFLKGHKVRVSIASCNFPRFNRNSNSGKKIAFDQKEDYRVAHNTIYHDQDHPSCIILPVVER